MSETPQTAVLYNGSCPICSREIDHYAAYATRNNLPIRFDDLNGPELARWGVDADSAARRLYVLKDGQLLSGVDAFIVLWAEMPRFAWLSRLVGLPGVRQLARVVYDRVLAPLLYARHVARQRRKASM